MQSQINQTESYEYLQYEQSLIRKNQVEGLINYKLFLLLYKGEKYQAKVQIELNLIKNEDLLIDYDCDNIQIIKINNTLITKEQYKLIGKFLIISKEKLKIGKNIIDVNFYNNYSQNGYGLHSYLDETTSQQYIYSNLEPAYCKKWFPCLDQPDLKATLKLYCIIPNEWIAISNQYVTSKQSFQQPFLDFDIHIQIFELDYQLYEFEITKPLSTYLLHISAGPFQQIKSVNIYKNIGMSIYCRESQYKYLENQQTYYFETTIKCLLFYEKFFQINYPFIKYDYIIVPELVVSGMENAGAVTISEDYVFKNKVDKDTLCSLLVLISHECCHSWFGNLVTMKWWDDLWLKESFADFMSYYCLDSFMLTFDYFDYWAKFNHKKKDAYSQDISNATHPIKVIVNDTFAATTVYDHITYQKGSATIYQLLSIIGHDKFSQALSIYFQKFQYTNTTLLDFFQCLSPYFQHYLHIQTWIQQWILNAGCNSLQPSFLNDHQLLITQSFTIPQFNMLRYHKVKIAFYQHDAQVYIIEQIIPDQKETIIQIQNLYQYQAVLINYEDQDYCKIILDQKSLFYFTKNLNKIKGQVNKQIIIQSLFEMIKDAKATAKTFIDFIQNNSDKISTDTLKSILHYLFSAIENYSPLQIQDQLNQISYNLCKDQLLQCAQEDEDYENKMNILQDYLIRFCTNKKDLKEMILWLKGEKCLVDHELQYYNRWDLILNIHKNQQISVETKMEILEQQLSKEEDLTTDDVWDNKIICETSIIKEKKQLDALWELFVNPDQSSPYDIYAKMKGFNIKKKNNSKYHKLFFSSLQKIFDKQSTKYVTNFFENLFPFTDDFKFLIKELELLIEKYQNTDSRSTFLKSLLVEQLDFIIRRKNACIFYQQNQIY